MNKLLLCCGNVLKAVVDTSNIVVEFDGSGNISNLSDIVEDVKEQVQDKVVAEVKEQVQDKVAEVKETTEAINNAVNLAENIVKVTEELNKDTKA